MVAREVDIIQEVTKETKLLVCHTEYFRVKFDGSFVPVEELMLVSFTLPFTYLSTTTNRTVG